MYRWSIQGEHTSVGHTKGQDAVVGTMSDGPEKSVPGEVVTLIPGKVLDLGNPENVQIVQPVSTVSQKISRRLLPKTHVS